MVVYSLQYTEATALATSKSNFLARRLRSCDGHLGRGGAEIQRIAKAAGLSVHMVQSLAMGRRKMTEEHKKNLRQVISGG